MKKEIIGYKFVRSENIVVRNDYYVKEPLLKEGFIEKGPPTGGNVRLVKRSKAIIIYEDRGREMEIDLHDEICEYYGVKSLKNARVKIFIAELFSGKVQIKYNKNTYKYEIIEAESKKKKKNN